MRPDYCPCGCTERLDEFGQLDPCPDFLEYLDALPESAFDEYGRVRLGVEAACWEGLRAA